MERKMIVGLGLAARSAIIFRSISESGFDVYLGSDATMCTYLT